MSVGNELKMQREMRNLTQKDVEKGTGITQQAISLWESNKRRANIEDLIKLADFYEITVDELIGHEVKKNF